ncbi:MAG TPA: succinylglutamate-semialdehyde dehydrogenase [Humisphaera sp.]|jgi:succinylglutamic semialdehyde dehydrogenase|nr:succinylglutamate-semialdehyde dehydrogenase [Humisphaera sp.]
MSEGKTHFVGHGWIEGDGPHFESTDPATGQTIWSGRTAGSAQIDKAISAGRAAIENWASTPLALRIAAVERFAEQLKSHRDRLATAICRETGKPHWEALAEVDAMVGKVPLSIRAYNERRAPTSSESGGVLSATRYKPFGLLAVFGPFNMPGHLPNGHIVPALIAGNCVVYKPSELTPLVGQLTMELWESAGLLAGVITLLQGGRDTGAALVKHAGIDGVLFTGSVAGGLAISRALVEQPGKIVALEMGGNNPLIVWNAADLNAAANLTIHSAYITAGQRCSCARRLIIPRDRVGQEFVDRLLAMMKSIVVGPYTHRPEPFMGPVISDSAADSLLCSQEDLIRRGGQSLAPMRVIGPRTAMLTPGLIDVTNVSDRADAELFGPILQVIRVATFDDAISEANRTKFGLVSGLLSDDPNLWTNFYKQTRAAVVYWNRQTTGGSSALPFGGTGLSGNHRPSGYLAADYCAYPVASMESAELKSAKATPGLGQIL